MQYNEYGRTGKKVSAVGFGGMRFDTSRPKEENAELLHYAQSLGINYFDTAPGYCSDTSEDIFGLALKDMTGEYYVSTKGMPERNETKAKAKASVYRSLERLGVDAIDFYHIWCLRKMENYHLAMAPGGQYEGLLELQQEGLIKHIVCSSHQSGEEIRTILADGKMEGVLLGLSILNFPYRWDGVQHAQATGRGVVAMNPLGGGLIPRHHNELAFLAQNGETPTEAALRFVINCPGVAVALVGFTDREHIRLACEMAEQAEPFDEEALAAIRSRLGEHMDQACTGCGYCRDCPAGIAVPSYMQVYNERQLFQRDDAAMQKLIKGQRGWGMLAASQGYAADCTACGACETACTQHLPIIERLKEMAQWEQAED